MLIIGFFLAILIILIISGTINGKKYEKIQREILNSLGLIDWMKEPYYDICVTAINYEEFQKYSIDYFLEKNERRINNIASDIQKKDELSSKIQTFLARNSYDNCPQYKLIESKILQEQRRVANYRVKIDFTATGSSKTINITQSDVDRYKLGKEILTELEISSWHIMLPFDDHVIVKSRQALENYNLTKYFKDDRGRLNVAEHTLLERKDLSLKLNAFLKNNHYKNHPQYRAIVYKINSLLERMDTYQVYIEYISSAGNSLGQISISATLKDIDNYKNNPSLLMGKGEYSKYIKEQQKEALEQKQHLYYEKVNDIIKKADDNRDFLVIKVDRDHLDNLITQLFDRTVNSIKKIKGIDSEEWNVIGDFIDHINEQERKILTLNRKILDYYDSPDFLKIKSTCDTLMSTQRDFNEYINEKVNSIYSLFGTKIVRQETINSDEYNYIRPYKKIITPFTAEVSAAVFASAENSPLDYIIKNFYPNKQSYPEQIQKLQLLVEELETLREAKEIIENYKQEYQQYLSDVPDFIMQNDESGFYSRLGFANIDESTLTVEYKFVYTSGGGMAQRSFTVPMNEETIIELINALESKLTLSAFAKEQRAMMTTKLREFIKERDNFTCCNCGNSIYKEPNLLLEIDHIIPVSKGGCTVEDNLQTLCWKCNRAKSDKII